MPGTPIIQIARRTLVLIAFGVLAALAAGTAPAQAKTYEVSVSKASVADMLDDVVGQMQILLDNHGSKHTSGGEASWLEEDASYIRVSGLGERRFTIPEERVKNLRLYKAYVSDLRSSDVDAYVSGSAIELSAQFESGGLEMPVHCTRWALLKKYRWKAGCLIPLVGDGVQVQNARLTVTLVPVAHGNSISFAPDPKIAFSADVYSEGFCGVFDGFCNWLTGYKKRLRTNAEDAARKLIGDEYTRAYVATAVYKELRDRGIVPDGSAVTGLRSEDGNYVLTIYRPNLIRADSIKIDSFEALTHSLTTTCPVNVGFRATISAKTAVSGRAWLQHDNGATTDPLPFTAKQGTWTSMLVRKFYGQTGQSYPLRYSKLILTWQDEDGASYHTSSGWQFFTVNCIKSAGTFVAP